MARDLKTYDVWLLISGAELFPLSAHGFEAAQGPLKSVIARSADSLFLNADGEVFRIAAIHPRQNSPAAKAKRLLGLGYEIDVELERHTVELSQLKEMLITGLENYRALTYEDESWTFATWPAERAEASIRNAKDAAQLFAVLDLPAPTECLDLL